MNAPSHGGILQRFREYLPVTDRTPLRSLHAGGTPLVQHKDGEEQQAHAEVCGRGQHRRREERRTEQRPSQLLDGDCQLREAEPLPAESPLWQAPGLIVSPHMSGDVVGSGSMANRM